MNTVTRFAPSPTGYLHLGHAYSALFAFEVAQKSGGKFLLRIEDIDPVRCKPEFTEAIFEDLGWLGLTWEQPVRKQSEHMADYAVALDKLRGLGVLYPCFCTRREIAEEAAASGYAPHDISEITRNMIGGVPLPLAGGVRGGLANTRPELISPPSVPPASGREAQSAPSCQTLYPGTCRNLSLQKQTEKLTQHTTANWRLDVAKAMELTGALTWHDRARGEISARPEDFGDVVLARKDVPTSYHLSVTVDDHLQGVTLVTRGEDLFRATDIHRLLQALLGYHVSTYHHHSLMLDDSGRRYAKRDKAVTLRSLRADGIKPEQLIEKINKFS